MRRHERLGHVAVLAGLSTALCEQIEGLDAISELQAEAIERGLPEARVVKLPTANHYVFLSNEVEVLRELRAFLGRLW